MPIYVKHPQRPDGEPFVFFKGTMAELKRIEPSTIEELLASNLPKIGESRYDPYFHELRKAAVAELRKKVQESLRKWPSYNRKQTHLLIDFPEGNIQFVLRKLKGRRVAIYQHPPLHTIMYPPIDSFLMVKTIIRNGFKSTATDQNVDFGWRRGIQLRTPSKSLEEKTKGDSYQFEFMAPVNNMTLEHSPPNQILRINIRLDRHHGRSELESKRAFYKKHLRGVPFGLINKLVER
jgi:hypothetical protein